MSKSKMVSGLMFLQPLVQVPVSPAFQIPACGDILCGEDSRKLYNVSPHIRLQLRLAPLASSPTLSISACPGATPDIMPAECGSATNLYGSGIRAKTSDSGVISVAAKTSSLVMHTLPAAIFGSPALGSLNGFGNLLRSSKQSSARCCHFFTSSTILARQDRTTLMQTLGLYSNLSAPISNARSLPRSVKRLPICCFTTACRSRDSWRNSSSSKWSL